MQHMVLSFKTSHILEALPELEIYLVLTCVHSVVFYYICCVGCVPPLMTCAVPQNVQQ